MPQIFVTTDVPGGERATVLLRERVTLPDLESDHFAAQLVERLGWAVVDADDLEHPGDEGWTDSNEPGALSSPLD